MRSAILFVVAALGLVVVAQAGAHAEITPKKVPAGGDSTFVLAVESEESGPTVKIAMQVPPGMANLKPANVRGWQVNLGSRVVTWTGGRIPQGETGRFEILGQFPRTPGETLKFPVVQTYGNGKVVHWIGTPASQRPAPTIQLTAAVTAQSPPAATTPTTPTTATIQDDDDNGSAGWIIGGAIAVGLIAAGAVLLLRRSR